jgi:hypothetical protein
MKLAMLRCGTQVGYAEVLMFSTHQIRWVNKLFWRNDTIDRSSTSRNSTPAATHEAIGLAKRVNLDHSGSTGVQTGVLRLIADQRSKSSAVTSSN